MRATILLLLGIFIADASAAARGRCEPGEAVFKARCARCHGETGKTDTPDARALKVAPLVNDARIAAMTPAEIVELVKSDPKHRGVVDLQDADLEGAAVFVKTLAARPQP